jgi:hypothetical protein
MGCAARLTLLLPLVALVAASIATPAQAAKRKVPFGLFGTVLPPEMLNPQLVSDATLEQQMTFMARSGVESVRMNVYWPDIETAPGVYDWTSVDRLVAAAASHGFAILATVTSAPQWARKRPNVGSSPPVPRLYAEFARQLVLRYGSRGTLWAENPTLPRVPIRQWQVWNEQMAPWFWAATPWQRTYVPVLKAAYRAIHRADRGAKVIAGSLVAVRGYNQWDGIRDLYRAGAKRYFDVIAVHPFTNNPRSVSNTIWRTLEIVRRVRGPMRGHGDGRKPIILTELSWPAAVGKVPRNRLLGLETTALGQIKRLKAAYRQLARVWRKTRLTQAYWYAWATEYDARGPGINVSFRFAGLNRFTDGVFSPMPVLRTYADVAAKYQGCRKSSNARRCR